MRCWGVFSSRQDLFTSSKNEVGKSLTYECAPVLSSPMLPYAVESNALVAHVYFIVKSLNHRCSCVNVLNPATADAELHLNKLSSH